MQWNRDKCTNIGWSVPWHIPTHDKTLCCTTVHVSRYSQFLTMFANSKYVLPSYSRCQVNSYCISVTSIYFPKMKWKSGEWKTLKLPSIAHRHTHCAPHWWYEHEWRRMLRLKLNVTNGNYIEVKMSFYFVDTWMLNPERLILKFAK